MYQKRGESTMNLKKITSLFLVCSMVGNSSAFCFAEGSIGDFNTPEEMSKIATEDIDKCKLDVAMESAICQFEREVFGQNSTSKVSKFNNGDALWENGKYSFAKYAGDEIWLHEGKTKFIKPSNGLLTPEKLQEYATRWNAFPKSIMNIANSIEKNSNNFRSIETPISKSQNSSFKFPFIIISTIAGLGYLIYKNIKMIRAQNNASPQNQVNP